MKKLLKGSALIVFALFVLGCLSGCIFTLNAPTINLNGYVLEWDSQASASKYQVVLNDETVYVNDTNLNIAQYLQNSGSYKVKVKAFSKSLFYKDSDFSEELNIVVPETKLAAPTGVILNTSNHKYKVSWNGVSNASFYLVKLTNTVINKDFFFETENTNYDFTNAMTQGGQYSVSVKAYAETLETYAPSVFSDSVEFESIGYLTTPSLNLNANTLSWDSIDGATSYIVATNEGKTITTTSNSVNLLEHPTLLSSDNITALFVQAISGNAYNYDSAYSNGQTWYRELTKTALRDTNLEYMNNSFDLCADDANELQNIVFYAMYYRLDSIKFCSSYLTRSAVSSAVHDKLNDYNEIMSITYATSISGDIITLKINFEHPNTPTKIASGSKTVAQSNKVTPTSYASTPRDDSFDDFLINTRTKSLVVFSSEQLYVALQNGYKPVFTSTNSPARSVYERGKEVLREIISNDMTELQKLNAIYDWLSYTVKYDYNLLQTTELLENTNPTGAQAELSKYDGFYIEGVMFDGGQAVCDGISKTLVMLASIENITCYKVSGRANGGNHAWNKVALDLNDDDEKEWYTIDVTWGDMTVQDGNSYTEYLSHTYYLVTDAMITNNSHQETDPNTNVSNTMFNYYYNTTLTDGINTSNLYIESATQLARLKAIMQARGINGLDIEISPELSNYDRITINNYLGANFNNRGENIKSSYNTNRTIYVIYLN